MSFIRLEDGSYLELACLEALYIVQDRHSAGMWRIEGRFQNATVHTPASTHPVSTYDSREAAQRDLDIMMASLSVRTLASMRGGR